MGQALWHAMGRAQALGHRPTPVEPVKNVECRPTVGPTGLEPPAAAGQDHVGVPDPESIPIMESENVLEERDPGHDAMLSQMVGRITSRPGGKLELGKNYKRPLPKLRGSKAEVEGDGQRSAPPGTLTAAQLQEIILLHQGKSEQHQGFKVQWGFLISLKDSE